MIRKDYFMQRINEFKEKNPLLSKYDLQYSLNELSHILEESESLKNKIMYTPETVTVVSTNEDGNQKYSISLNDIKRLAECEDITQVEAIEKVKDEIPNKPDNALFSIFIDGDMNIENLDANTVDHKDFEKVTEWLNEYADNLEELLEFTGGIR